MNIALISPNKTSYSETFIEAQKNGISGKVFYYYDGAPPTKLEGKGSIIIPFGDFRKRYGLLFKDVKSQSLKTSFKKHKIDVVLAHYGPTGESVVDVCSALKIPLVVHFHGYDAAIQSVISKNNNYTKVFEYATAVIAVSKLMTSLLISLGCPEEKIIYNPCAPSDAFLHINPNFKKPQFLALGRFVDKKAPYLTLLAFKKVVDLYPTAYLIMGGDGPLRNTCINLAKQFGLVNHVAFPGAITSTQFQKDLKESLAFVQHSITADNGDMEGTPVAILEASAAGLPVVSTYHAGIPDVIIHEQTGLLCHEHDVDTMAEHMLRLLRDVDYSKQLGQSGKAYIKANFSMEHHLSTLQQVLESAVKNT
ncbi:glycosyltransferase [Paucihalobacter ruber]|uniref:Glycosyltransferase n=1 Tax=Paucihalobacter ruber TaxID=2567861 RepID=A0A506PJ93_9FLAO|nr:glycosyltransferase [Paucihalobacter ruber]TPV33861.1 glycosyltransferase [Paucihalobacter ruber]